MFWVAKTAALLCLLMMTAVPAYAGVGVYYFPGWASTSRFWKDIKGTKDSRSPGKSWPERKPLLGFYKEEDLRVAEQHIDWAASYGISFFAYDWYWNGKSTYLNHAIDNFQHARNKAKLRFTVAWANDPYGPKSVNEFNGMVDYWLSHYFNDPQYLYIDGKPVVIVASPSTLDGVTATLGVTTRSLLDAARAKAVSRGFKGIYFVGSAIAASSWVNDKLPKDGYDALTAYNYHSRGFTGERNGSEPSATTYKELSDGYISEWDWILAHSSLPYFLPVTAGWDSRPWGSNTPHDNCDSSPQQFRNLLKEAKARLDRYPDKTKGITIIYAWNEFGEGGYIEPTKKWKYQYLQAIKDILAK